MLVISHVARSIMEGVTKLYDLNKYPETNNTYYYPMRYLGTNIGKFDLPDGNGNAWFMSGD